MPCGARKSIMIQTALLSATMISATTQCALIAVHPGWVLRTSLSLCIQTSSGRWENAQSVTTLGFGLTQIPEERPCQQTRLVFQSLSQKVLSRLIVCTGGTADLKAMPNYSVTHRGGQNSSGPWRTLLGHYAGTEFSLKVLADYLDSNFARFHFNCNHCHAVITHRFAVSASACQCLCCLRCVFGFLFDRTHLTYTKRAICPIHDDNTRFTLPNIPVRRAVYADVFLKEKYPTGAIPDAGEL
jgi:hypothetical protein